MMRNENAPDLSKQYSDIFPLSPLEIRALLERGVEQKVEDREVSQRNCKRH